jgi:hypothetical protein
MQRIVSVVGVGIAIYLGAYDTAKNRSINIWSILGYLPIATTEATVWPPQVTQHASVVQDTVISMHDNRIPLNPGLVAVPLKDLENLCHGASLLSQNLAIVYKKFQVAADAAQNNQRATNLLPEMWTYPPKVAGLHRLQQHPDMLSYGQKASILFCMLYLQRPFAKIELANN